MPDIQTFIEIGTLISVIVAIFGLAFGIRTYRRQTNAQIFIEYTSRYERIMESFPPEALSARLELDADPPEQSQELSLSILRYLNMTSEEYYLNRRGYLSNEVWEIWEDELIRTLKSPLLKREWKSIKKEFISYTEFHDYVEGIQKETTF